jgi:hypothetical protein
VQVKHGHWTNPSVLMLAGDDNPIDVITQKARTVVFDAIQNGWSGPPFDPFTLAEYLKIGIVPREDIAEARTVPLGSQLSQSEDIRHKPTVIYAPSMTCWKKPNCSSTNRNGRMSGRVAIRRKF